MRENILSEKSKWYNTVAWTISSIVVVYGLYAHWYYQGSKWYLHFLGALTCLLVVLLMLWRTTQGQSFIKFSQEATIELRKVVWPGSPEVIKMSAIVSLIVALTSLLLWVMDAGFTVALNYFIV